MMSESALSRHAGPIVLVVGAYLAVSHLALAFVFMSFSDPAEMLADPIFRGLSLAYAAAFSGLAIAACAAYDKQARQAGTLGLVALCAAIIGTVNLGANMWFEGFAAPWLADEVPQILTAEKTTVLEGRLLLQLPTLLHRLGALRACLPASQGFSTSYQSRDCGRRHHRLPGGATTVRRSTGVGAVEPRDLDGQDSEGRRHACAADHGLIALWTASHNCCGGPLVRAFRRGWESLAPELATRQVRPWPSPAEIPTAQAKPCNRRCRLR